MGAPKIAMKKRSAAPEPSSLQPPCKKVKAAMTPFKANRLKGGSGAYAKTADAEPSKKGKAAFTTDSIVRRTAVKSNSTYLDKRCDTCDGLTVKACLGQPYLKGSGAEAKYTLADLRYDLQANRIEIVTGAAAVAVAAKAAAAKPEVPVVRAPPQKMAIECFYAFAQCSLRMEARHFMKHDFELKDAQAAEMWPEVEKMFSRNLGKNEKWVPWHTVLGVHEKFVVDEIHQAKVPWWTDHHRFVAMFLFRCHCKCDLFLEVQMPYLKQKAFWKNLSAGFDASSAMEKDMLKFRAEGRPLQTSCFLIIPERILKDDDQNLVRNIMLRSQRLISLANDLWPLLNNPKISIGEKYTTIKNGILGTKQLGDTWVKMLMVVIDIALPRLRLLQDQCEVGNGAADPMRQLLEDEGILEPKEDRIPVNLSTDSGNGVSVVTALSQGIVSVKREGGGQLIQVTSGMAGSVDRAYAVALVLGELAAQKGLHQKDQDILKKRRQQLFDDKQLKVPKLDLDLKRQELLAREKKPQGPSASDALGTLCERINSSEGSSAELFWTMLANVEKHGCKHFSAQPIIVEQMKTRRRKLSAVTLQVQLCEFRQYGNYKRMNAASSDEVN